MWSAVGAGLKIAMLILVFYLKRLADPRLLALKEEKRSEKEEQDFRTAIHEGDADTVSRLLSRRLRRLRRKDDLLNGNGKGHLSKSRRKRE